MANSSMTSPKHDGRSSITTSTSETTTSNTASWFSVANFTQLVLPPPNFLAHASARSKMLSAVTNIQSLRPAPGPSLLHAVYLFADPS